MAHTGQVVSHGLDYVRYAIESEQDLQYIGAAVPYVEVVGRWMHGKRFVDFAGSALALIRTFDDLETLVEGLAVLYPVTRLDVYIDVVGDVLDKVGQPGTCIFNGGRLETIYSHNLKVRGDRPTFARVYDAKAAGHYLFPVTRFEVEFKRNHVKGIIDNTGFRCNPIAVALNAIRVLFGYELVIDGIEPVELDAPETRLEHSRERFYRRYGKNILVDLEQMGHQTFYQFVLECVQEGYEDGTRTS